MDELVALADAAAEQDARRINASAVLGATSQAVAAGWMRGERPSDIAAGLRVTKATVTFHLRRLGAADRRGTSAVVQSSRRWEGRGSA